MKRIAIISEHASPLADPGSVDSGGQNIYVQKTAAHLAAHGHQVDVFTRRDSADQSRIVYLRKNLRVIHVPAGPACFVPKECLLPHMNAFRDFMINFLIESPPYDVIHANFFMSGMVACDLNERFGVPFTITFHALGRVRRHFQKHLDQFPDERFDIEEEIVRRASSIIAECPQDREDLVNLYNADPEKIWIIPCGFDDDELYPVPREAAKRRLGFGAGEKLVLSLGRMVPRKGIANAVQGFSLLRERFGVDAKLLVVGGASPDPDPVLTPEIRRLQDEARRLGVTPWVRFMGRACREELKYYYSAADVFVTTPLYEPFGITPVESLACGTPVIGSNVGGIKFTVQDGQNGYLVSPGDPGALASRMADLLADPEKRGAFSAHAIHTARSRFLWKSVARRIARCYDETIQREAVFAGKAVDPFPVNEEAGLGASLEKEEQGPR